MKKSLSTCLVLDHDCVYPLVTKAVSLQQQKPRKNWTKLTMNKKYIEQVFSPTTSEIYIFFAHLKKKELFSGTLLIWSPTGNRNLVVLTVIKRVL